MNLKGVGFINYLYIIILGLGTWINVNIFSSIQWFGILLYIYNVFCVDDRGKQYFKNLRFLIVFLMSFTSLIVIFHCYVLYEYLESPNQEEYYKEITNLGFEYNKHTNILQETIINIILSFTSFVLSLLVFIQLNTQEDIFEGKGEDGRVSARRTVNQSNTFQSILGKYEWAQRFISTILILLMFATVLIDGLFGVFYSIILASWMLAKLSNRGNDLQVQIDTDKKFLTFMKYFSLLTCYCSVLWKLNIFVRQYKGIVYMINGYVTSYTVLFITTFILELLLFMFTVYAYDLLSQLNSQHVNALRIKQDKILSNPSAIKTFFTGNYFGIITALCFLWANIIPSLLMFIPLLILLIGSVHRKQRDVKLKTAISISYFSYIFLIVIIIFNIPFLFKYVTGSLLFNLLGLHSYNEEEGGVDGLLDRMGFLSMYLITISTIYYITLLKAQEKEVSQIHLPHLNQSHPLNASGASSHHSQFHPLPQHQSSELTLPPPQRIEDDDEEEQNQSEDQHSVNSHRIQEGESLRASSVRQGDSANESYLSKERKKKEKKKKSKFVQGLKQFWEGLTRTSLLHLEKLNVCLIFAISIYRIDIIHAFYMIAFMFLVFSHMKHWRTIMRVVIAYSYAVIILHYTITVLYESKAITKISDTLLLIGIHEDPTIETFLTIQTFEVVIVLILTYCQANIVYVTDTYNEYRAQSIELEEDTTSLERKQELVRKMDFISRFFIKYGVWICYINLLSVGLIPPANILSLGYLMFLQLFISFTMYENQERKALKKIMKGWPLLVIISSFILIVRYFSLFDSLNELLQQLVPSKKVLEDIGLSNELNTLQICGNAFILLILNAQRRLIDAKLYEEEVEQDNLEGQSDSAEVTKRYHRSISYSFYQLKIKFLFLLATHFSKIVLFYGLLLSILHYSFAGVVACFVQMLIFLWGREEYWKKVWVPLWVISFTFLLTQYLFQLHIIGDNLTDDEKSWAGVFSIKTDRYWIFLVLYILQQILCVLMRKLQLFENRINGNSYKSFLLDYDQIREGYLSEKKRLDEESEKELLDMLNEEEKERYKEELQSKEAQQSLSLSKSKSKKDSMFESIQSPLGLLSKTSSARKPKLSQEEQSNFQKMLNKDNYQLFLKWNPYKRSTEIEYELKEFFKYYGYDISIFVLILAAYFEMNAVSLVHIILAVFFAFFSYVINSSQMYSPRLLLFVNYIWRSINYLMVIDITRKYIISIWFPSEWKVNKPWNNWQFDCDKKGKNAYSDHLNNGITDDAQKISDYDECTHDWKYWLSLEEESNLHLILDIINFQIMVIYDRYFREIYSQHGPKRSHESIHSKDELDFTRKNNLTNYTKLFIFGYFYQIPIMLYFIIGCLNNISSYTDIISIIYVFTSIFMLFKTKMLLREKNNVWKYLLMFNTVVMVILCLYQSPFFRCPILYPEDRYYLNSDECLLLQNTKKGQLYILEVLNREVDSSEDLYILMSHIFGFNKSEHFHFGITKEVFMIFFVLFGLLQKNLWNHPYTEHYIEPYFREQKEKQKENAVSIIEAIHVARINNNAQQEMELEVYDSIQQRVENKVVLWDKMVSQGDHTGTHVSIPEEHHQLLQFEKNKEDVNQAKAAVGLVQDEESAKQLAQTEKEYEAIMHKAEKIVLESKIAIHLKDVIRLCTIYSRKPEKLEIELENLRTKNECLAIEEVYQNPYIGIQDYKDQMQEQHRQRRQKIQEILQKTLISSDQDLEGKEKITEQEQEQEGDVAQEDLLIKQLTVQQDQEAEESKQQHQPIASAAQSIIVEDVQQKDEIAEKKQQKNIKRLLLKVKEVFSAIKKMIINLLCSMLSELNSDKISLLKEENSLALVIIIFLQRKFQLICCFSFILGAVMNADLVSIIYPISYFIYALIESPFPNRYYWKFIMYYGILLITVKFLYQLPVFCGSPPYTFFLFSDDATCNFYNLTSEQARTRIDFLIGIKKYTGPSSYPRNQGFFFGILWDYIILLCLFIQRYLLQLEGKWTYIYLSKDECYIPQFRDPVVEYQKYRKLPLDDQMKNSFSLDDVTDATIQSSEHDDLDHEVHHDEEIPEQNILSIHSIQEESNVPQRQSPQNINPNNENEEVIEEQRDQVIHRNLLQDLNQSQDESRDEVASLNSQQRKSVHSEEEDDEEDSQEIYRRMNFISLFVYRLFPQYLQGYYDKMIEKEDKKYDKKEKQREQLTEEEQEALEELHEAKKDLLDQKEDDIKGSKPGRNYYIHQFVSSFFVLIFIILFYTKMVSHSSTDTITNESRFSRSIVILILICISVMVMDRILYKLRRVKTLFIDLKQANDMVEERKNDQTEHAAIAKLIMHITLTIGIHIYLFFVVPDQTHSTFHSNPYLIICYLLVVVYLYFSSLQIKFGYPQMSVGSIFSRDTSLIYRISFIVYRALPFLYELRSVIDWTFTSTSLDIFQWFKLEDAYANLYSVKAEMNVRKETHKFGQKRDFFEKCSNGFLFLLVLLVVILLPIFLFSNLNPAVELNNLQQGTVRLEFQCKLTGKEYHVRIYQKNGIEVTDFTNQQFSMFSDMFYGVDDLWEERLQVIKFDKFSDKEQEFNYNMVRDLEKYFNNPELEMGILIDLTFNRPKPEGKETVKGKSMINFNKEQIEEMKKILSEMRKDMQSDVKEKSKSFSITLYQFIPFFQHIPDGQSSVSRPFEPSDKRELEKYNQSLPKQILDDPTYDRSVFSATDAELVFIMQEGEYQWQIKRKPAPYFDKIVPNTDDRISFITLSEMAFSSILRQMSDNLSVVGIYLTVVLTVGRFLRIYFNNISMRCIWEEMPETDDLFDLCQSIYIARLEQNLIKEERNYELLIRIMRSPEILMRLTGTSLYEQ